MANPFDVFDAQTDPSLLLKLAADAKQLQPDQPTFTLHGKQYNIADIEKQQPNPFDAFDANPAVSAQSAPNAAVADTSPYMVPFIAMGRSADKAAAALEQATLGAGSTVSRALGANQFAGTLDSRLAKLKQQQAEADKAYAPLAEAHPGLTLEGELPGMMLGRTPLGMAGIAAASTYGSPEERAKAGGMTYAGGKLGELGGSLLGRLVNPVRPSATAPTAGILGDYGVTGLPGQVTGSKPLQWMESILGNLPGGGRIRDITAGQNQALRQATMQAAGGMGEAVTPEAVTAAQQASGGRIGKLTSSVPAVAVDDALLNDLGKVESRYANKLDALQKPVVQKLIDQISGNNSMTGAFYQATRSDLRGMAQSAGDSSFGQALNGIRGALDRAFDRSAPEGIGDAVRAARTQLRVGKVIEPMATATGDISPARLANAAKNLPPSQLPLTQFAAALKQLPDSTTAQRLMYQGLLSGGIGSLQALASGDPTEGLKWGAGAFAAPWLATQALTRAPLAPYLSRGMAKISPEVERFLRYAGSVPGGLLGLQSGR